MFSCNPKASKSRKEIYSLTMKEKDISKERIKDVCTYPEFNTEDQEELLSTIENELAPPLRELVESQNVTDDSAYMLRKLTSLLIAGSLRFRYVYSEMENKVLLGDNNKKYSIEGFRIQGRLDYTLLCADKIQETLDNKYQTMFLFTAKNESFITSDNPVFFHAKEDSREDYIIDFTEIEPSPLYDENTKHISGIRYSYKVEKIRLPAAVLYVPLSSRTLLMLIDNNKLHYEAFFDRLMVSVDEVNHFNNHVFGNCMECVYASSTSLLQQCKGIVKPEGIGIITTYTNS